MNTPLLTFNAKSVSCEKLETTLTARRPIADRTFTNLKRNIKLGGNYQSLIIAPRGSGKSHLTKVMYCRITADKELRKKVLVAYMIEDESGIASFMHLMLHILDALHRYDEPGTQGIQEIKQEISEISSKRQEAAFEQALLTILGDRKLVLLIENFDVIISQMGDDGAGLRDFMHNYDKISILATSQSLTDKLNNSDYPFYQFFDTQHLQKLTFEEMLELVEALISIEEDEELRVKLGKALHDSSQDFKSKLRAIFDLTMGNHRLIVDFYSFLKADLKSDLSTVFIRQMNNLKSYYEQFIKQLSTQQQRIVQVLSQNRKPITPKDISQKAFLKPNSVSKQLNELEKMGYVDVHKVGRNSLYELNEPLMRISYEINENPDGIAALFVNFLKAVYDRKYLIKHYLKYKYSQHLVPNLKEKYKREMQLHRKAFGADLKLEKYRSLQFKNSNSLADIEIASENLAELEEMYAKVFECYENNKAEKGIEILDSFKDEFKEREEYHMIYGNGKSAIKKYKEAIKCYKRALEIKPDLEAAYFNLGYTYSEIEDYENAINNFEKGIEINPEDGEAFNNLGISFCKIGDLKSGIKKFEKAIELNPELTDPYNNMGVVSRIEKKYSTAINYFKLAIELDPQESNYYYNLGYCYEIQEDYGNAKMNYIKVIELNPKDGAAYFSLGNIYYEIDEYKNAIKNYKKSIEINPNFDEVYYELGLAYSVLENHKNAIENYRKAIEIDPEYLEAKLNLMLDLIYSGQGSQAIEQWNESKQLRISDDFLIENINYIFRVWIWDPTIELNYAFTIFDEMLNLSVIKFDEPLAAQILGAFNDINREKKDSYKRLHQMYMERFGKDDRLMLTNKFFDIGIRYLIFGEEKAIYDFTKEERTVFLDTLNEN